MRFVAIPLLAVTLLAGAVLRSYTLKSAQEAEQGIMLPGATMSKAGIADSGMDGVAMAIGSAGQGTGGVAKGNDMGLLGTSEDLKDFDGWTQREGWYNYGTMNMEGHIGGVHSVLQEIKGFCKGARDHDKRALIYYSGHGEEGSGNWCFRDGGRISLSDVISSCSPIPKEGLEIRSDACFSGQWAYHANEMAYDNVVVETSAGPLTSAIDRVYAKEVFAAHPGDGDIDRLAADDLGAVRYSRGKVHYLKGAVDFHMCIRNGIHRPTPRDVTAQAFSSDSAMVVLSTMPHRTWRQWVCTGHFDYVKKKIQKAWDDGYALTSLQHTRDSDFWSMVMAKGAGVYSDEWHTYNGLDNLEKPCPSDKRILDVSYGHPWDWMFVCGKTEEIGVQRWFWSDAYGHINDRMHKAWDDGYSITTIAKGGDGQKIYFVVMSKISTAGAQTVLWTSEDKKLDAIEEEWDKGKRITALVDDYDNDKDKRYWVVMTKMEGSKLFPNKDAAQHWQSGLHL